MKILLPYFELNGKNSYPDTAELFDGLTLVTIDSTNYWLTDYSGSLNLETGAHTYANDYVEPPVVIDTGIRRITKRSFMRRFTLAERIAIRTSTDSIVIDLHEDLKMASNVDLDIPELTAGLQYLVSQNILTADRAAELTVDGSTEET